MRPHDPKFYNSHLRERLNTAKLNANRLRFKQKKNKKQYFLIILFISRFASKLNSFFLCFFFVWVFSKSAGKLLNKRRPLPPAEIAVYKDEEYEKAVKSQKVNAYKVKSSEYIFTKHKTKQVE